MIICPICCLHTATDLRLNKATQIIFTIMDWMYGGPTFDPAEFTESQLLSNSSLTQSTHEYI